MLGYKTVRKEHRSTSRGGGAPQVSTSFSEERRAVLLPQEIKELPADEELIFYEGCRPIRAKKNWFFKDKRLQERAGLPTKKVARSVQVPPTFRRTAMVRKPTNTRVLAALAQ